MALGSAILGLVIALVVQPEFSSGTTFAPEARSARGVGSAGAALASQLGFSLGGANATESPRFYANVVESRIILGDVLQHHFRTWKDGAPSGDSATLLDLLEVEGATPARRFATGLKDFGERVTTSVDQPTGIVSLDVLMPEPHLAADVANRIVVRLQDFNLDKRQSSARARRVFAEERTKEMENGLREAESALRGFLERNRLWQSSPQLQFEHGRLERRVQLAQEVYLTLQRELQTARIDEVNDTPGLTVIDSAVAPQRRAKPKRVALILFMGILGFALGVTAAVLIEYIRRVERDTPETAAELRALGSGIVDSLRRKSS